MSFEDFPPAENVIVLIGHGRRMKSVSLIPNDIRIYWSQENGFVTLAVSRVDVHRVLVIE